MTHLRELDAGDAAVLKFVNRMRPADRELVKAWLRSGFDPLDAVVRSGLLNGERRHPPRPSRTRTQKVARLSDVTS